MNFHIVGASHAARLGKVLPRTTLPVDEDSNSQEALAISVSNLGKPGRRFRDLVWPDVSNVSEGDFLLVLPFGNDLQKNRASFTNFPGRRFRFYHLESARYRPVSQEEYLELIDGLIAKLNSYRCHKIVVTNFFRFINCRHCFNPGWLSLQKKLNKILEQKLNELDSVFVIPHYEILEPQPSKKTACKNLKKYVAMQYDNVHFLSYTYLAESVLRVSLGIQRWSS